MVRTVGFLGAFSLGSTRSPSVDTWDNVSPGGTTPSAVNEKLGHCLVSGDLAALHIEPRRRPLPVMRPMLIKIIAYGYY